MPLLEEFEALRKNRASTIQYMSNAGQDEAAAVEKIIQRFNLGPVPSTRR